MDETIFGLDYVIIGPTVKLAKISVLKRILGVDGDLHARRLLDALEIPTMRVHKQYYFNVLTFEMAVYHLLDIGRPSFWVPETKGGYGSSKAVSLPVELRSALSDPESPLHAQRALAGLSAGYGSKREVEKKLQKLGTSLLKGVKQSSKVLRGDG